MAKTIELDTFGKLLENTESFSKVIEIAIEIDERLPDYSENSSEAPTQYNLYGSVIKELCKAKHEDSEFDAFISLQVATDELEDDDPEYISVCLKNNNYSESIVIQPEINFDDYRNYETFAMDFVPWSQLLNKTISVSKAASKHIPSGYSVEEFALGHILWEITFYGFSSDKIEKVANGIKNISKKSLADLDELLESDIESSLDE